MLKKSQNDKSEQEITEQTKTKKLSFKERIHDVFDDAALSMTDFKENSGKSLAKWSLVYLIIAFLSLFLFNADKQLDLIEYPFVLSLIVPRMMSLFLFTCPVLKLKKRKSSFILMTALWFMWHCISFDRIKLGLATTVILIFCAILVYFGEKDNESVRYIKLFNSLQLYMLYSILMVFALQIAQMKSFVEPFETFLLQPDIFACNLLCFAAFGSVVFWIKRPKSGIVIYTVLWAALAIISFCKSIKTFEPVLFLDVF